MIVSCPQCNRVYQAELSKTDPQFREHFQEWKFRRGLIQNIWPDATPIQREQLQTGICSDECWNKYLGVGE